MLTISDSNIFIEILQFKVLTALLVPWRTLKLCAKHYCIVKLHVNWMKWPWVCGVCILSTVFDFLANILDLLRCWQFKVTKIFTQMLGPYEVIHKQLDLIYLRHTSIWSDVLWISAKMCCYVFFNIDCSWSFLQNCYF